jgi:hypothetical protein
MTKIPITKISKKDLLFGNWVIGIYLGFGACDLVLTPEE